MLTVASAAVRKSAKHSTDIPLTGKQRFIDAYDIEFRGFLRSPERRIAAGRPNVKWDGYRLRLPLMPRVKSGNREYRDC